jgi:hypothetical protein
MLITAEEIEELELSKEKNDVAKIKVLRAHGELPINEQVGATCGIYALDAALRIRGLMYAPRKQFFGDWRLKKFPKTGSIRGIAKNINLSKIGEISSVADMENLANVTKGAAHVVDEAACLGVQAAIKKFYSQEELWRLIVDEVDKGRAIVMPYACAGDDGTPAWSSIGAQGFAHWCLLFGYVEKSRGSRLKDAVLQRVFMTTYGYYHEVSPYRLFKANQRIQDWPRQTWIKLFYWYKKPEEPAFELWRAEWTGKDTAMDSIKGNAQSFAQNAPGWGFGFGTKGEMLYKIINPPNPTPNLDFSRENVRKATVKSEVIEEVKYTQTFCSQCVVV